MTKLPTAQRPAVGTVREWTIALGVLTAGQMTRADAEIKLRAYVPLLQDQFPPDAFTQGSLHHVAAQCKWFPSYAEVVEHLRGWWRDHRPAPPPALALAPPALPTLRDLPDAEERAYVHARVREIIGFLHSVDGDPRPPAPPRPAYLTAEQLDRLNPLPDGARRATPLAERGA